MKRYLKWRSIGILSVFALFVCLAPAAVAQEEDQETPPAGSSKAKPEQETAADDPAGEPPPEEAEPAEEVPGKRGVEEIVVTGSRIRTNPMETPAPVVNLSSEDIERTGLTSIGDVLQRLPSSGGSLNTRFNSSGNFGFPPDGGGIAAGAAQVDLRYLGSKRVLVLVDGIRWVSGSSASGVATATDLNTIPTSIIERVEVLEDGASAIYGSDAIAGVVNIITKKDFEGMSANLQVGGFVNHQDGLTQQYDLSWGNRSERMTMFLNLSYTNQDTVFANDRDISRYATPGFQECTFLCSSGTPQGRFYVGNDPNGNSFDITLNDNVGGMPQFDLDNPGSLDYHDWSHADRFNYAQYNLVQTPSERLGIFSALKYELTDNVAVHAKALYNNRKSRNRAAPEPLFIGPEAGNGNRMDTIVVHETNPYNPFGFTLDSNSGYFIGRRPIEAGPRIFDQNVNTWYLSGGLQGSFAIGENNFFWDATALFSVNRADQIKRGGFNSAKLQKALGPLDVCQDDPECVPFNIFGGQGANREGTITREMLDYVTFIQKDVSHQELFDFTANVTGDLFSLPGGNVGLAAGMELRNLNGYFRPDAVVTAGDSAGVPSSPTSGGYHVAEGYAEIVVPIMSETPGLDLLDLAGAVRVSDYSTFGAEQTFKLGMRWKPFADLMLRGNFSQGFRAPAIGELYGSAARFDQMLEDPCSDMLGVHGGDPKDQQTIDNCIAQGVPADGSYQQFNPQISVTTGGNRNLQPETSNGITAGLVYSPGWVNYTDFADQLDIEISYYWIKLDDAIQPIDAETQLAMCVADPASGLCEGISRTAGGVINGFNNRLTNIGGIETDGLDLTITYTSPRTTAGRFRVISMTNVMLSFEEKIPTAGGFETIEHLGTEIGDPERAYPDFKTSLILGWALGDFSASLTGRFIASIEETCISDLAAEYPQTCSNPGEGVNVLDSAVYLDAQVTWFPSALDERLFVSLGVNNFLNADPPICYSCALNGFDATTYDVPGIYGYLRCGYQM